MPNRDLNPHAEAEVAMCLWNEEYAQGRLGSMGFWDTRTRSQKDTCAEIVDKVDKARRWTGRRH